MNRMKLISGSFLHCRRALKGPVLHLWDVYSSPSPSGRDVPTLLSLCLSLAVITGGLLYHWLSKTLKYGHDASVQTACAYAALMMLASFLCHPLRCVLTMTLPTVCTKQGRKLLVSASVMILILNVIPNIALNVGAVARILKCTTEGFTRSLLNSSEPLNRAKQDLMDERMIANMANLLKNTNVLRQLAPLTNVDVSGVEARLRTMVGQIELNFSRTTDLLQDVLLLSNRVLAALYVALLVFESSRYLKSYLSSVRFGHSSRELQRNASDGGGSATPRPPLLPLRCRIRSHECPSCVVALLVVTFYFFVITVVVAMDHAVYHVVDLIMPWLLDLPSTSIVLDVGYKLSGFLPHQCVFSCTTQDLTYFINHHRQYTWTYDPEPSLCKAATSAPSRGVAVLLGCLCVMSYSLVFLEVYAKRLCREICASFFREQERPRGEHGRKKECRVFSITLRADVKSAVGLGQRGE